MSKPTKINGTYVQRRELTAIIGITCLGLALRVAFLLAMKANWPGWDSPTIDALYHHLWALKIADGEFLSGGPYFRAPLYPFFLGFLYTIFGVNFSTVIFVQHCIGALSIPLVYIAAKRFFSQPVAFAAAFITAINGILIYFESQLLLDFLTVLFYLVFLIFLDRANQRKTIVGFLLAGLVASLFAITRPNILAVIPLVIIWIMMAKYDLQNRIRHSVVLVIGVIILIIPVTIRNVIVGSDTVMIASQGGINFYIGNNEQADGMTALLPGFGHTWQYSDAKYEASVELGMKSNEIKPSEVSLYYFDKSLNYIISEPVKFAKLMVKKLYMFWNRFEISNNNNLYFLTDYIGMSSIPLYLFIIISPMGFVGSILCFTKDRRFWIFPILIFGYMATVVTFFVTARFRIPLIPLLSIMSAFTIHEIYMHVKAKHYKKGGTIILSVLVIGFFAWTDFYDHHNQPMTAAHYSLGNILMRKGDYDGAKREFKLALDGNYRMPNASLNLGVIAFYEKDIPNAKEQFNDEIRLCGPNAKAYSNLSMLSRLDNEYKLAVAWADSAINHYPNFKEGYINQIQAALITGNLSQANKSVAMYLELFPDDPGAQYYAGLTLYQRGDISRSESYFNNAVEFSDNDIISEYNLSEIQTSSLPYGYNLTLIKGRSYYQLGLISVQKGDIPEALDNFQKAISLMPNDPDAMVNLALAYDHLNDYQNAVTYFKKAISIDSSSAVYYFNYAMTLGKLGEYQQSIKMLEKALEFNPDFDRAKQVLETLLKQLE